MITNNVHKILVEYDLSSASIEGVIREKLIEMGWTPPESEEPKEHPLQKYIELGLDMEFTSVNSFNFPVIGKLMEIVDSTSNTFTSDIHGTADYCRLRPNHVHWWEGKTDINPIPDDCEFRHYLNSGNWSDWYLSGTATVKTWSNILAFEIRYD